MKRLKQLTPQEVFFVGGETNCIYQHTGGLVILQSADGSQMDFETFKRNLIARIKDIPHFRWKLHQIPLGLDLPYWIEDKNFNYANHIKRIALPRPGDEKVLAETVSLLYSRHLDRNKPLWESWFIEGLPDGKFALFQKLHHAMMDGEGAAQLGAAITDFEPDASPPKVSPAIADARPGEVPEFWRQCLNATNNLSRAPFRTGREVLSAVRTNMKDLIAKGGFFGKREAVPVVCFNNDIGSLRGLVFGSLSLADIKKVKSHFNATVNDVVLAVVGSSLREYLIKHDDLPQESLRAFIAVSLRTEKDDNFSNRVTSATVTLGTQLKDPVARLKSIIADTEEAKSRAHHGANNFLEMIQFFPPALVNMLLQFTPPQIVPTMTGANLLVSNVKGSPQPMYMAGARVVATYPMSIISPGAAVNVTCLSYMDHLDVGVTLDPDSFPDPWTFIDGLKKSLAGYVALTDTGKTRRRRKRPATKTKGKPRAKRARSS